MTGQPRAREWKKTMAENSTVITVPIQVREGIAQIQGRLSIEKGRNVTIAEALEYLLAQERKTVAP